MRSDDIKSGYKRAPNRALLRSLGVTDREMDLPFIGIANAYNTIVPGHIHLCQLAEKVHEGIAAHEMAKCVAAGGSDLCMPDAMKIGGVTGWLRAAAIAESAGLPVSSHLFPEVSAHLLAVSPTGHWLEYVDWANPILEKPLEIDGGQAVIADAPGTGIAWNEENVARYGAN